MDVQLPDGTILRDVPDGTTKAQIVQKLKANGRAVPADWLSPATDAQKAEPSMLSQAGQHIGNAAAGLVRGAGSIGATIVAPYDIAKDALAGKGLSLESNRQRRADMDGGLQEMGAQPGSKVFKGFKLGGEVAGTLGAGGAIANVVGRAAPVFAAANPNLLTAISSAGMEAGGATGLANPLIRAAGGAINGGVSAGMVNPEDAVMGAAVGGALPGAVQIVGKASNALGRVVRGPAQTADASAAIQAARDSGYVIPPTQANPTLLNRVLEGFSGKITTAQNASAKNQAVTNTKAATAIGLPAETKITPEVLDGVRAEAGKAYKAVSELGTFDATGVALPASVNVAKTPANTLMGKPESASVDAGEVVRAWRQANADATAYFRQYARDANPETLTKAKGAASEAKNLDGFMMKSVEGAQKGAPAKLIADLASGAIDQQSFLQKALALTKQGNLAEELKAARTLIAKTHSVEDALNTATGSIDAKKLAKQLQKGKPLSGDLKEAAEFAGRFPKASQTVEQMGSLPQTSPLDWSLAGGASMATGNPLLLAAALARPASRAVTLSPLVQNRLVQRPNALSALAIPDSVRRAGYQSALLAGSDR
jgi:hypothetical protein